MGELAVRPHYLLASLLLAALVATGLTACNTVEGAGRDLKAAGKKIEDTARDVRN
jgi:predicted small secreted protein